MTPAEILRQLAAVAPALSAGADALENEPALIAQVQRLLTEASADDALIAELRARIAELEAQVPPPAVDVVSLTELINLSHGPVPSDARDFDGTPFAKHDAIPRGKPRPWLTHATNNVVDGFPVRRKYGGKTITYNAINNWWEAFPYPGGMSAQDRTARLVFTPGTVLFWHPDGPDEWRDVTPAKEPKFNGYLWTGMSDLYDNAPNSRLVFRKDADGVYSFPLAGTTNPDGSPFDDRNPAHWYNPGQYDKKLVVPDGSAVCVLGYMWLGHDDPDADLSSAKFVACLSMDLFEGPDGGAQAGEVHKHYGTGKPRLVRLGTTPALVGTLRGWPASKFDELPPVPRPPMPAL